MTDLYKKLIEYAKGNAYPFHMPGHKRNYTFLPESPFVYDITEIEGFDNLHEAQGVLHDGMKGMADYYGADSSFYLVNGSTCGILAAISACVSRRGKILIARNSHKAAYHALFLRELEAVYVYPSLLEDWGITGGISPNEVRKLLEKEENKGIEAVFITSPTYEGVVSDIAAIADICHEKHLPLIVDEAHGAHFSRSESMPVSALDKGADIVIQSLHKTLPSLTQTAVLHIQGSRILPENIQKFLAIYETSSPSYVLMASIDACVSWCKAYGRQAFEDYEKRLEEFYRKCKELKNIRILTKDIIGKQNVFDFDRGKIVIFPEKAGYTGKQFYDTLLKEFELPLEMAAGHYVVAMTSVMDTDEGFERLFSALQILENRNRRIESKKISQKTWHDIQPIIRQSTASAQEAAACQIPFSESIGRIAVDYLYLYPPGIPMIVPGEEITQEIVEVLEEQEEAGLEIKGWIKKKEGEIEIQVKAERTEEKEGNVSST